MAEIWLYNSIARRRRSASDTFLENGLAALRGHLEAKGHSVRIIDWATENDYADLSPGPVARFNRAITARLIALRKSSGGTLLRRLGFQVLFLVSLPTQSLEDLILSARMKKRLRRLAAQVAENGVKLFGIKVWYGESFDWAERLCRYLHAASPNTVVIAGGHQPTLYEEEFLTRTSFDLAVVSQGELPMTRLLDLADEMFRVGSFTKAAFVARAAEEAAAARLRNLMYRNNGSVLKTERYKRLNGGIYMPRYDEAGGKVSIHVVIESLGCTWGKCNFCVHRHFYDGFEPRNVGGIVREIDHLRKTGVGIFRFAGSDTPPDLGRAIGEAILEKGITIEFGMGSRALKGIGDEKIYRKAVEAYEVLIRSGLRAVFMGGESGHSWVNETVMNKGLDPEEVALTIGALREAQANLDTHVDVSLAFIYPVPTMGKVSQEEVFRANLDLIKRTQPDSVMVTPPGPFRNTEWNRNAAAYGFELDEDWLDRLVRYEYVLYKPPFLWKRLPVRFEQKSFTNALALCGRMRNAIDDDLGIPTDLSDEHFLMLRAAGFDGREGAREFKQITMLDLVSGDYRRIREMTRAVNERSRALASSGNRKSPGLRR